MVIRVNQEKEEKRKNRATVLSWFRVALKVHLNTREMRSANTEIRCETCLVI